MTVLRPLLAASAASATLLTLSTLLAGPAAPAEPDSDTWGRSWALSSPSTPLLR
jgi:hypothetical protein